MGPRRNFVLVFAVSARGSNLDWDAIARDVADEGRDNAHGRGDLKGHRSCRCLECITRWDGSGSYAWILMPPRFRHRRLRFAQPRPRKPQPSPERTRCRRLRRQRRPARRKAALTPRRNRLTPLPGVAGLHRLLAHAEELAQAQVVIAIAGMARWRALSAVW